MDVQTQFTKATEYVRGLPKDGPVKPSIELKLKFYGLFKQATEGDNTTDKPGLLSLEARKKWQAWTDVKGTAAEDAMKAYIAELSQLDDKWNGA